DLVCARVHAHLRRPAEIRRVVAAAVFSRVTDLQQKLPGSREREHVSVLLAVAADPDAIGRVDGDAMNLLRPLVALSRTSPCLNDAAGRIKLDYRRRRR